MHRGNRVEERADRVIRADDGRTIEDVASVQKSVASVLVGIAQQKGLLKIEDRVDKYLGVGCPGRGPA